MRAAVWFTTLLATTGYDHAGAALFLIFSPHLRSKKEMQLDLLDSMFQLKLIQQSLLNQSSQPQPALSHETNDTQTLFFLLRKHFHN